MQPPANIKYEVKDWDVTLGSPEPSLDEHTPTAKLGINIWTDRGCFIGKAMTISSYFGSHELLMQRLEARCICRQCRGLYLWG